MNLVKFISSLVKGGKREVSVNCFGDYDPRTATEIAPYGTDANPIPGIKVVYAPTATNGQQVVLGCENRKQAALPGEHRIYSTDTDGNQITYIWLHNAAGDGQIEIGGDSRHMVRYEELETAFNQLKDKVNELIEAFNTHAHASFGTPPVPIFPAAWVIPIPDTAADISPAKINEIKTL